MYSSPLFRIGRNHLSKNIYFQHFFFLTADQLNIAECNITMERDKLTGFLIKTV